MLNDNEYLLIVLTISVVSFIIGLFLGVKLVKFFSSELVYKLERALDKEIKLLDAYRNEAISIIVQKIHQKVDLVKQINEELSRIRQSLTNNAYTIDQINAQCDKRNELESEIIKLKKIIQRMEKKHVQ